MTKVNLFHEESSFDVMVDFPETPQIDDSVNILNFLPYHSQERNHLREYLEEKRLNFTLKVIERT